MRIRSQTDIYSYHCLSQRIKLSIAKILVNMSSNQALSKNKIKLAKKQRLNTIYNMRVQDRGHRVRLPHFLLLMLLTLLALPDSSYCCTDKNCNRCSDQDPSICYSCSQGYELPDGKTKCVEDGYTYISPLAAYAIVIGALICLIFVIAGCFFFAFKVIKGSRTLRYR